MSKQDKAILRINKLSEKPLIVEWESKWRGHKVRVTDRLDSKRMRYLGLIYDLMRDEDNTHLEAIGKTLIRLIPQDILDETEKFDVYARLLTRGRGIKPKLEITTNWYEIPWRFTITPDGECEWCERYDIVTKRPKSFAFLIRQAAVLLISVVWIGISTKSLQALENKIQITQKPAKNTSFVLKYETNTKQGARFDILVNPEIYDSLETYLLQYAFDLEHDYNPYNVTIHSCDVDSSQADSVRNFLKQRYESDSIIGAVFVGSLPYQMYQGMDSYNVYQEFPSETFFRDVDGQWLDTLMRTEDYTLVPGTDGIYDTHIDGQGDRETEIDIGRIDASNLNYGNDIFGGEIQRLKNYFEKNHAYRLKELTSKDTALVYFDDDWADLTDSAGNELIQVYPNIISVSDSNETTADDYKARLQEGYQWIWLVTHSSSIAHQFLENNGNNWGYLDNEEIPEINPQTLFSLVNGCYAGRFTQEDCILNHYIFSSDKGQVSIGYSARAPPPTALYNSGFFSTLGAEGNFGEALKRVVDNNINSQPIDPWKPNGYALVLLGDPTLKPRYGNNVGVEIADENHNHGLEYKVVPNIVKNEFSIQFADPAYNLEGISVSIYDVKGGLIGKYPVGKINTRDLPSGIYFVNLEKDGKRIGSGVQKIVKF